MMAGILAEQHGGADGRYLVGKPHLIADCQGWQSNICMQTDLQNGFKLIGTRLMLSPEAAG